MRSRYWRAVLVLTTFLYLFPSTTFAIQGDPIDENATLGGETVGTLRVQMRMDNGTPFIYPCVNEMAALHGLIQYQLAPGLDPDLISDSYIEVDDSDGQPVWYVDEGTSSAPSFTDSGFDTRANGGTDADGSPNFDEINDDSHCYKFLDPNGGTYTAKLVIYLIDHEAPYVAETPFEARTRNVFISNVAGSDFEGFAKMWMFKVYGVSFTSTSWVPPADPAGSDSDELFIDGTNIVGAYDCVTPRGHFYMAAHGEDDFAAFIVGQNEYTGWAGPAGNVQGTYGSDAQPPPLDILNHAMAHVTNVEMLTCYSADYLFPLLNDTDTDVSVIDSWSNSLAETVGGGGTITGARGIVRIDDLWDVAPLGFSSNIPSSQVNNFKENFLRPSARQQLINDNDFTNTTFATQWWPSPNWVQAHDNNSFQVAFNNTESQQILTRAVNAWTAANHPAPSVQLNSVLVTLDINGVIKTYDNQAVTIDIPSVP